jgi:hypothetical protein
MDKEHAKNCANLTVTNMAAGNVIPKECDCDGYHAFNELYDHRLILFIALCNCVETLNVEIGKGTGKVWRSKLHADGTMYDGWFIMGINKERGEQISYHLPLNRWEETNFAKTLDNAPEWDGHTPADILERLKTL